MPRRLLRRYLPSPQQLSQNRVLQPLSRLLHEPNLWHLNRRSVSLSFFIGTFIAFLPLPMHMLLASGACILLRCNIACAVALVWISNPVTMPPMFYATYRLGAWMMGMPAQHLGFEPSLSWITQEMQAIWRPLLLGCVSSGLVAGVLSSIGIRIVWRVHVQRKWLRRRRLRLARRIHS